MNVRFLALGLVLTAVILFAASPPVHADTLACLYVGPGGSFCGGLPACVDDSGTPCTNDGSLFQINLCLDTDAGQTDGPPGTPNPDVSPPVLQEGDIRVTGTNVEITMQYGIDATPNTPGAGVDAVASNFPGPSPEGHVVVWVDQVPVLEMGAVAGIADRQNGCPEEDY